MFKSILKKIRLIWKQETNTFQYNDNEITAINDNNDNQYTFDDDDL